MHRQVCLSMLLFVSSSCLLAQAVHRFKGGETEALARLKYYLWDTDLLATYFQTRNGMLGGDYSTKFSPWLAHGCLSSRTIYHEIQKYESERKANKSTYWVVFELLWRDYFRCRSWTDSAVFRALSIYLYEQAPA